METKENVRITVICLLYILQKNCLNRGCTYLKARLLCVTFMYLLPRQFVGDSRIVCWCRLIQKFCI